MYFINYLNMASMCWLSKDLFNLVMYKSIIVGLINKLNKASLSQDAAL